MTAHYTIALATTADIADVGQAFDAYRQFYRQPADLEGARAFIRDHITQNTSRIWIARDVENALMGFTQVYPSFSSVGMRPIWIVNDLFVHPDVRRQGVARELLDAVLRSGHSKGISSLVLATEITNNAAQSLYRSLGYVQDTQFLHFRLPLQ